jgi:urocanate hydratase
MVITNGLMIGRYNDQQDYNRLFALGVTQYGQMTAGSFCYIGPQGIVHGTVLTVLNGIRKYLGKNVGDEPVVFFSSGLGGMSGAQAKAPEFIPNLIAVIAEVDKKVIDKRMKQGWVQKMSEDSQEVIDMILKFKEEAATRTDEKPKGVSIAFHGNVISLWRSFVHYYSTTGVNLVDLASDQTSCHNVYGGGYIPEGLTLEGAHALLKEDVEKFKLLVDDSLRAHISLINRLSDVGTKFYDYGNAFLLRCHEVGAEVEALEGHHKFRYPSYVEDIMGDIFSLGFGPFRWVCMSQDVNDLRETDNIALRVMQMILNNNQVNNEDQANQYRDNINWIKCCLEDPSLVVGSVARILYSDQLGRVLIAQAFNQAIKQGKLTGPVVISRDHHDVSGTDSPFRETANIEDGSNVTADMATHNFVGTGVRGASWIALHNGGGVGWGQVVNGGFGLVLTGKQEDNERIKTLMSFDVSNGIARRSWSKNKTAKRTIIDAMKADPKLMVTIPYDSDEEDIEP